MDNNRNEDIKKEFVRFLKENNAYMKYRINLKNYCMNNSDFFHLPKTSGNKLLGYAFFWDETKEGYTFWKELNNKWQRKCKHK